MSGEDGASIDLVSFEVPVFSERGGGEGRWRWAVSASSIVSALEGGGEAVWAELVGRTTVS